MVTITHRGQEATAGTVEEAVLIAKANAAFEVANAAALSKDAVERAYAVYTLCLEADVAPEIARFAYQGYADALVKHQSLVGIEQSNLDFGLGI